MPGAASSRPPKLADTPPVPASPPAAGRAGAARSLFWSAVETFGASGLSVLSLLLLARLLTPTELGLGALATAVVMLAVVPLEVLFHDALVQRRELDQRHIDSAWTVIVILSALVMAGVLVLAPWLAQRLNEPSLGPLIQGSAIAVPALGVASIVGAVLRRQMMFRPLARRTILGRAAGVIAGVAAAFAGLGAWSLVIMYAAAQVFATTILLATTRDLPRLRLSIPALRELSRFAAASLVAQLLQAGNARLFMVALGVLLPVQELGLFHLGYRVVEELRNTLSNAAYQIALPLLSQRAHQPEMFRSVYRSASSFTALLLLPMFAGLGLVAHQIVPIVFGAQWIGAAAAMGWLSLAAVLSLYRQYSGVAVNAMGRPGLNIIINAAGFAASMALVFALPARSADDAALVWMIRAALIVPISLWAVQRVGVLAWPRQLEPMWLASVAGLVMTAIVLGLQYGRIAWVAQLPALNLAGLLIAAGAAAYVLTAATLGWRSIRDLGLFLRAGVKRTPEAV